MPVEIRSLPRRLPPWWRGLLEEWGRLMDAYSGLFPADAPYWYGELPLTGFLVAAAWRLPGGWGLMEFSAPRRRGDTRVWGAGDAWIGQGESSWCAVEAKCPPIETTDLEDASQKCRDALDKATEDLRALEQQYRGDHPIAVCYIVPNLLESGRDTRPERIQALFDGLAARLQGPQSVIGLYRPPGNGIRIDIDEHRSWPGVVLVGEAVA